MTPSEAWYRGPVTRGVANPRYSTFPQRLRKARKAAGLSCAELSRRAGLGTYTVAAIEAGLRLPRLPAAAKLARALGMTPGELAYDLGGAVPERPELGAAALAQRVRQVREAHGLSARAVATAATITEGTIRAIEKRGGMPTIDTLEQLAIALGVSPSWLAFGQGEMVVLVRRRATSAAAPEP